MSAEDRFDRLERRLLVLEEIVRKRLPLAESAPVLTEAALPQELPAPIRGRDWATRMRPASTAESAKPLADAASSVEVPAPRYGLNWNPRLTPASTGESTPTARDLYQSTRAPEEEKERNKLSAEQWFGQRGMLGVGVLLLLLAVAYFLKVAIDRGWISPAARCIAAVLAGHAVVALGWRLHRRGTAIYGAALIGAGAGLIYLGIWAAARWYTLVSPEIGIVSLLYVGISISAIAYQLDIEALGAAAALGALLGPIVISPDAGSANTLLLYLGGVGATLGVAAARRPWRVTTFLSVVTAFLLAVMAVPQANGFIAFGFAVLGGTACLSLHRKWDETSLAGLIGAWACLFLIPASPSGHWLTIVGAVLLALPMWWETIRAQPGSTTEDSVVVPGASTLDESFFFTVSALGALLAPRVFEQAATTPNAYLIYLAVVGGAFGFAAVHRGWRLPAFLIIPTTMLLALGVGLFPPTVLPVLLFAIPALTLAFAIIGGLSCSWLRHRWAESGIIGLLAAWGLLFQLTTVAGQHGLIALAGILLSAPIWWDALRRNIIWPDGSAVESDEQWSVPESALFYLTPVMLGGLVAAAFPAWSATHLGRIPLLLAVPYLIAGYVRVGPFRKSRSTFALVGTTAAALAALTWPGNGIGAVLTLLGLALLWAGLDHVQVRRDGRWFSLLALTLAGARFITIIRPVESAAFVDLWALVLWAMIGATAALALGVWRVGSSEAGALIPQDRALGEKALSGRDGFLDNNRTLPPHVPPILWVAAGAMLFGGVTNELSRLFGQMGLAPEVVRLASGLAVSTWWALYAGALVVFGFYRKLTPVRIAGLLVAGLAVGKVLFFDLANLDQLYRVGSFITLAVVLLLVAYLYNRQAANLRRESLLGVPEGGNDV